VGKKRLKAHCSDALKSFAAASNFMFSWLSAPRNFHCQHSKLVCDTNAEQKEFDELVYE
jgi:hypothetical protein